jgi:hypothetical protein
VGEEKASFLEDEVARACICSGEGVVANVTADVVVVKRVVLKAVAWLGADHWVETAGGVEVDDANVAGKDEACGVEVLELESAAVTWALGVEVEVKIVVQFGALSPLGPLDRLD